MHAVKLQRTSAFHRDLTAGVDAYFAATGRPRRDVPAMYLKSVVMLAWAAASWAFLVFTASSVPGLLVGALSLGLAIAGIGFGVQHDGNHGAYSRRAWVNRGMGGMLDVVGGSSYFWGWKHNIFHHTHPNVATLDPDISFDPLIRMAPSQPHRIGHRLQFLYAWVLYGLLVIWWHLGADFVDLVTGKIKGHTVPRPKGKALLGFVLGKLVFFSWAFAVPLLFHPLGHVALAYGLTAIVTGIMLATVFQLAHCVDAAEFPTVPASRMLPFDWASLQVETSVDFAPKNALASWYLGGLNFQLEHHLFPRICHLHFPALAAVVEATCRKHGLRYRSHPTVTSALASHMRWLREMGRQPATGRIVPA